MQFRYRPHERVPVCVFIDHSLNLYVSVVELTFRFVQLSSLLVPYVARDKQVKCAAIATSLLRDIRIREAKGNTF